MTADFDRVLVDVDGVLCRNLPRICTYVEEAYDIPADPTDVVEWQYEFDDTVTVGEAATHLLENRPEWYLTELPPVAGAVSGTRRLADAGLELTIVTHRDPSTHELTQAWLDDVGITYHEYVTDVPEVKAELTGDVLIDDFHGNVADAAAAGMVGVLFDHPYNSLPDSPRTTLCESWPAVVETLTDERAEITDASDHQNS